MDPANPLFFYHSDLSNYQLATKRLNGDNYNHWRRSAEVALSVRNKLDVINGTIAKPDPRSVDLPQWKRCNSTLISWILHSVGPEISESIIYCSIAQEIWEELEARYGQANRAQIYQLQKEIGTTVQGSQSVYVYFSKIKSIWDEYTSVVKLPPCTCPAGVALNQLL